MKGQITILGILFAAVLVIILGNVVPALLSTDYTNDSTCNGVSCNYVYSAQSPINAGLNASSTLSSGSDPYSTEATLTPLMINMVPVALMLAAFMGLVYITIASRG